MQKTSIIWFAIYHPYYKDKLSNITWSFVCATDNFYSLCSLSNLSTAAELDLVMKKKTAKKVFTFSFSSISISFFQLDAFGNPLGNI